MCTLHTMLAFVVFGCGEVVGGKRTKTNMMAVYYNLKYNLTIGKYSTSLAFRVCIMVTFKGTKCPEP